MNVKDATERLAKWSLLLQQYNFEIGHRPGKEHSNADSLSRRPYETKPDLSSFKIKKKILKLLKLENYRDETLS